MQKKLIALAVAGLVSGAAFAQSNVIIYGIADVGYVFGSDSYEDQNAVSTTDSLTAAKNNLKSGSSIYSGGQSTSRLGFKGTEDLGNGLNANFRLEQGFKLNNGGPNNTQPFGRWATVGLSGKNWGEVQIGRRDTFMDQMIGGFDVTGRNTSAQASPLMQDKARNSNMVAYISPNWSGFQLGAGVTTSAWDTESQTVVKNGTATISSVTGVPTTNSALRAAELSLAYINGPLKVGGVYEYSKYQDNNTKFEKGTQWVLAAAYDFGVVALSAEYGQIKAGDSGFFYNTSTTATQAQRLASLQVEKRKQWTVGLAAPIGAMDKVTLQYARGTNEIMNASDEKAHMWGIAYFHTLSKRTNLYAGYGSISQDDTNTVQYGIDGQGSYQKAFMAGVRHQF